MNLALNVTASSLDLDVARVGDDPKRRLRLDDLAGDSNLKIKQAASSSLVNVTRLLYGPSGFRRKYRRGSSNCCLSRLRKDTVTVSREPPIRAGVPAGSRTFFHIHTAFCYRMTLLLPWKPALIRIFPSSSRSQTLRRNLSRASTDLA